MVRLALMVFCSITKTRSVTRPSQQVTRAIRLIMEGLQKDLILGNLETRRDQDFYDLDLAR
jgi:GDP-D-mannose dehydratase